MWGGGDLRMRAPYLPLICPLSLSLPSCPLLACSGIPDIRAYLNGVHVKGLLVREGGGDIMEKELGGGEGLLASGRGRGEGQCRKGKGEGRGAT